MYIDELKFFYGDETPFYSTVKNWFNEFNCGRRSLKDEIRKRPPKTAVVDIRELIMQDRHEPSLGISPTNIHSILQQHLAVKRFILLGSRPI